MKKDLPRVAVCVTSGDMLHAGFAHSLAAMMSYDCAKFALIGHRTSLIHKGRDALVVEAMKFNPDYILFLDSDMVFPAWTLARLLSHDKDIVGATYVNRTPPHQLHIKTLGGERQVVQTGLHEVAGLPTGMLLTRPKVFRDMTRPYFRAPSIEQGKNFGECLGEIDFKREIVKHLAEYAPDDGEARTIGEDFYFCAVARARGYKLWLDVDLTADIGHIGEKVHFPITGSTEEEALAKLEVVNG